MTEPPEQPRRQRRETAEIQHGIGGLPPHPARGEVTALRVLGEGFEIPVDADLAERLDVVGTEFMFKGLAVLALDEPTRQLIEPLTAYCGLSAHSDVDSALRAILRPYPKRPLILQGARAADVAELARTIHEHTTRKGFPFTQVNTVPTSDAAIEALCTQGGCGTLFLDLTTPVTLPSSLVRHLLANLDFSSLERDHYHLATIAVASTTHDAFRCFGMDDPFCTLGFRRAPWHSAMRNVTFTEH